MVTSTSTSEPAARRCPSTSRLSSETLFPTADRSTTGLESIRQCISMYHGNFFLMESAQQWMRGGKVSHTTVTHPICSQFHSRLVYLPPSLRLRALGQSPTFSHSFSCMQSLDYTESEISIKVAAGGMYIHRDTVLHRGPELDEARLLCPLAGRVVQKEHLCNSTEVIHQLLSLCA